MSIDPSLSGILAALITGTLAYLLSSRKNNADAAEATSRASVALIEPLTKRLEKLEGKVAALEKLNFEYLIGIKRLLRQLIGADLKPVWVPREIDLESVKEMDDENNT